MEITFDCPHCEATIEADSEISGVQAECPACNEVVLVPAPGIEVGMDLAGYRIDKRVGVGGMGEVFEATQLAMKRRVALKVLPPGVTNDEVLVGRFMHEVEMAAKLEHANIVTAFDAGKAQGYYYMAMSFVEGVDLDKRVQGGPIPEEEGLKICLKVADALGYAWRRYGMLHRDIKPANIMIDSDGEVKLMDMGIAKMITEDSNLTMAGSLVGTPYYMSPEQATANADIDCRADIYSTAASLYYLLTGTKPFDGPNAMAIIAKHISETPEDPRQRNPDISEPCRDLILRLMAKDPEDRAKDWEDFIEQVHLVMDGQSPGAAPVSPFAPAAGTPDSIPSLKQDSAAVSEEELDLKVTPARPEENLHTIEISSAKAKSTSTAGPPPPPASSTATEDSSEEPILEGGPAADEVKGVKLGMAASAAIGVLVIVLLAGLGYYLFQSAEAKKHEAKLRQKEKENEALRQSGSVEVQIAKITAGARAEAQEEIKREDLGKMFGYAVEYAKKNPDDIGGARAKFERILQYSRGTEYELRAEDELAKLRKRSRRSGEDVLRELKQQAQKLAQQSQFGPAARLFLDHNGPGAAATEAERRKIAEHLQERARATEKLMEFLRFVIAEILQGNVEKAQETVRDARSSKAFAGQQDTFESNVRPLMRVSQIALRYPIDNARSQPPDSIAEVELYRILQLLHQGETTAVRKRVQKQPELLRLILIGESYERDLTGDWQAVDFTGDQYRQQIRSVKLHLGKSTFRSSINSRKTVRGNYRICGDWLYFYRDGNGPEYWEIRGIKKQYIVLAPKNEVFLKMVRK